MEDRRDSSPTLRDRNKPHSKSLTCRFEINSKPRHLRRGFCFRSESFAWPLGYLSCLLLRFGPGGRFCALGSLVRMVVTLNARRLRVLRGAGSCRRCFRIWSLRLSRRCCLSNQVLPCRIPPGGNGGLWGRLIYHTAKVIRADFKLGEGRCGIEQEEQRSCTN